MASYLSSDALIASIKRRAAIPESQSTFEDDDFLAFANEEVAIGLVPTILQYHEEFLVYTKEIPLVQNVLSYPIPARAVGNKLRTIFYKDLQGNLYEMARVAPEDIAQHQGYDNVNSLRYFYLQNNNIVLVAPQNLYPSGSLVVSYYQRPNQLVTEDKVATVVSIDATSGTVEVDAIPSGFSISGTNLPLDFLERGAGHKTYAVDAIPTSLNTTLNAIVFDPADVPADLAIGDVIAVAGECSIPQVPDDLHSVLAQRVAARCLEALGDQNGLTAAYTKLQEMEMKMGNLIDNRAEGNPQKVVNSRGLFRRNFRRGR